VPVIRSNQSRRSSTEPVRPQRSNSQALGSIVGRDDDAAARIHGQPSGRRVLVSRIVSCPRQFAGASVPSQSLIQPAISVVVPAHNAERYLAAALDSLRAQTLSAWQAIVVDDGSSDGSAAIVGRYRDDARIAIVRQEHRGLAAARNHGLARCAAEYVAFLDADDLWQPTYLAEMADALDAEAEAVAAFAGWQYIDRSGQPLPQAIVPSRASADRLGDELLYRNALVPSGVVVRRAAIDACQGFDIEFVQAQDWDLWLRLLARGPFVAVPKRLVWYRTHGENMSEDVAVAERYRLKLLRRHLGIAGDPAGWTEAQRRAIGYAYFASALAYFRHGRLADGVDKTREALCNWPALTSRDETYYELGCAHQQRGRRGPFGEPQLERSTMLIRSLIFEQWPAPSPAARRAWWGHACLVLSQLAHESGDRAAARHLAVEAWRAVVPGQKTRALRALVRASLPGALLRWVRGEGHRQVAAE
jgi:glycosyltransferase involved in cell wall biosynthesis